MSSDELAILFKYRLVNQDYPVAARVDFSPSKAHYSDAGFDVRACTRTTTLILPNQRRLVPTGVVVDIPEGYELQVRPKSGLALKHGLTVLNTPGTIDSGYSGEIGVILYNSGREAYSVEPGQKIAQLVPNKLPYVAFIKSSENDMHVNAERQEGGFGSTGVK